MKVAGIDPGTIHTGVAILEENSKQHQVLFSDTINPNPKKVIAYRLHIIYQRLVEIFRQWQPEIVAIENVFFHIDFKAAVKIGEARAAAMIAAGECGIEVVEYLPTQIKSSVCGNGRAAKNQVQYMVKQAMNIKEDLQADRADAIAVAMCHIQNNRFNQLKKRAQYV